MAQGCCRNGGFSLHCAIFCPKDVTPLASARFLARPMMACARHEVALLPPVVIGGMYTYLPGLFSLI